MGDWAAIMATRTRRAWGQLVLADPQRRGVSGEVPDYLSDDLLTACHSEICLELGLPGSPLNETPYPHIFPQPPDLARLGLERDRTRADLWESDKGQFTTGWLYYLSEIALRRLQNRLLQSRHGDAAVDSDTKPVDFWESPPEIADFDAQLETW